MLKLLRLLAFDCQRLDMNDPRIHQQMELNRAANRAAKRRIKATMSLKKV